MPTYAFHCSCGSKAEIFFKSLPSEEKQKHAPCQECGRKMYRDHAQEEFFAVGGTNFDVQKAAMMAVPKEDQGGRLVPVYTDANGKKQEIRNSKDIDNWTVSNRLGTPQMVPWKNRITGETRYVPKRTIMKADPTTGEPADAGAVIREPAKLVPLPNHLDIPHESRTGRPLRTDGSLDKSRKMYAAEINPKTGKRSSIDELMEDDDGSRGRNPYVERKLRT